MQNVLLDLYPLEKGFANVFHYIADTQSKRYLDFIPLITGYMYTIFFMYTLYNVLTSDIITYSRITHIITSCIAIVMISSVLVLKFYGKDYCSYGDTKKEYVDKTVTLVYIIYVIHLLFDTAGMYNKYTLGIKTMSMTTGKALYLLLQTALLAGLKTYTVFTK